MKILQATMHQGDMSFAGHGRQCVANSMMAIIKSKAHNVDQWTEVDEDTVLRDGDRIYQLITNNSKLNSEYLLLDDLPSVLENNIIEKSIPKGGLINQRDTTSPFHYLEGAFSSLLAEMPNMDSMLLTVGRYKPSYTGAVIRQKQSNTLHFLILILEVRQECQEVKAKQLSHHIAVCPLFVYSYSTLLHHCLNMFLKYLTKS